MPWRQWRDRYAIHAGRNLPDKEFRYLRTVIVTAAVYWDFDSELSPLLLIFQHRAGVRLYTSPYSGLQSPVFLVNSRHSHFCAILDYLRKQGPSFSRSYRCNLPSSFKTLISNTLVYSTRPPVSVYGTVFTLELFPGTDLIADKI